MTENNKNPKPDKCGFLFETLCEILIFSKCVDNINYTEYLNDKTFKKINNITDILDSNIRRGDSKTDINIKLNDVNISFSIKYKNHFEPTETQIEMDTILKNLNINYKLGLFVKNKLLVINHKYKNNNDIHKKLYDKVIIDKLLFDENDIIISLDRFCNKFNKYKIDEFIEIINKDYLLEPRNPLILKLHQKMTLLKFINNKTKKKHLISHKPRSGKSITILSICNYLLENNYSKILIMTSVPDTIKSFIEDLKSFIEFKHINYFEQDKFKILSKTIFSGIVFCSVQYLKNNDKKEYLKNINFDVIITDESHQGSSTDKTKTDIIDIKNDFDELQKKVKLTIFSSGTSDKTKKYYSINSSCIYEWDLEDEASMKNLQNKNDKDIMENIINRHGIIFTECYNDNTLNKDYSKFPTQVLMKHSIPDGLILDINNYNKKYNRSSLFALNKDDEGNYKEKFELENNPEGIDILFWFFDCIISENKMMLIVY